MKHPLNSESPIKTNICNISNKLKINHPETEINFQEISNLNDYSEIIPQKIENENPNMNILEKEINHNLEFSFGKKINKNTNRSTDINYLETLNFNSDKNILKTDVLSDNLSNYQMTDSLPNITENNDNNNKLKIIKEKFISNFKNKERNESLERAFTLFEKFQNNLNSTRSNLSFSQNYNKQVFHFLTSQNTNSLSIIDNNMSTKNKNKKKFYLKKNSTLNTFKSQDDFNFFKYKIKKRTKIIKENSKENIDNNVINKSNNININNEVDNNKSKKIFNLKENKKGVFIRKVIREEKYFIDDEGKEKLIGIRQSTYDSHENNNIIKNDNNNNINNKNNINNQVNNNVEEKKDINKIKIIKNNIHSNNNTSLFN